MVSGRLFDGGGRAIDSSPMYGRAEQVVGELVEPQRQPFLATKVWTSGREEGIAQMQRSMRRMLPRGDRPFDLMQIHNLLDWQVHLPTLRAWKKEGRIRLIGVTQFEENLQQQPAGGTLRPIAVGHAVGQVDKVLVGRCDERAAGGDRSCCAGTGRTSRSRSACGCIRCPR